MGNVTTGGQLESGDLPPIEIDQISGEISGGQLANGSVTRIKLANYAIELYPRGSAAAECAVHRLSVVAGIDGEAVDVERQQLAERWYRSDERRKPALLRDL